MDERIWTIAEILDKSGPMTADELAAQLKLSGKTVRSLIKTYAKEMQENGFCITTKPGRGFGFEITDAQTYVSGSKPQQGERTGIPQDAQERIQRLRQYLLEKDGYSKLDDLSEVKLQRAARSGAAAGGIRAEHPPQTGLRHLRGGP